MEVAGAYATAGYGGSCGGFGFGGMTSTGIILVLFILLVIISRVFVW